MAYPYMCFCFFFQAEDGIRDATVTGVQTCALPIYDADKKTLLDLARNQLGSREYQLRKFVGLNERRSEERRVGKECRSRWWPDHYKKKAGGGIRPEV